MNARVYLTLLRPARTLAVIGLVTSMLAGGAGLFGHAPDRFLVLAIALPAAIAAALAGIIREPMHRPFILLLPGARARLRTSHGVALAVAVAGNVIALALKLPTLPVASAVGLVLAPLGLTTWLPAKAPPLVGSRFRVPVLAIVLLLAITRADALHAWALAYPESVLSLGLVAVSLALTFGFGRARLRTASNRFYLSLQSMLLDPEMAYLLGLRYGKSRQILSRPVSVDVRPVDGSTWSWVRTLFQARAPNPRRMMWAIGIVSFLMGALLPVFMHLLTANVRGGTSGSAAFMQRILASARAPDINFLIVFIVMVGMPRSYGRTRLRLPISRARLARVEFLSTLLLFVISAIPVVLGSITLVITMRVLSEQRLEWGDVRGILACAMVFGAFAPLRHGWLMHAARRRWATLGDAVFTGLFAGLSVVALRACGPALFSPLGLTMWVAVSIASIGFLRALSSRHYRKTDLVFRSRFRGS